MKLPTRLVAYAVTTLSMLVSVSAVAQDTVAAEALFDEGLEKMKAGAYEAACPALAESYRLEASPGTLFTLAECEKQAGLIASATAHYRDYLRTVRRLSPDQRERQQRREAIATESLRQLEPLLPLLTILLPENAPAGTTVTRDGAPLGRPSMGKSLPIDPGQHTIVVQLPSGAEKENTFSLAKGERKVIMLELPVETAAAEADEPPPVTTDEVAPSTAPPEQDRQHRMGPLEWTLGGVGLVGLAVGTTTGVLTLNKKKDVDEHCTNGVCDDSDSVDAAKTGKALGTTSTVGFAVGGAALATATILFLAGKSPREEARVRPLLTLTSDGGVLGAAGRW